MAAKPPCAFGNAPAKFDVRDGEAVLWHEGGAIPGEPVMVPRPGAKARPPVHAGLDAASTSVAHLLSKAARDTVLDVCCAFARSTGLLLRASPGTRHASHT